MPLLNIRHLSCQKGYNQLFDDVSLQVGSGELLRITGMNGSGKTALLKILVGLSAPQKGEVTLDNHPPGSPAYQQQIFYLGHASALSGTLTTIENLAFLMQLKHTTQRSLLTKALNRVGLKGYEYENCNRLSAGEKRRVILAGLFIATAKVWLLDEPFTALDTKGIQIIENAMSYHCKQGGLCLFTTHQNSSLPNQKILAL